MAPTNPSPVATLVSMGLERHEARWLVEEFLPGGDLAEMPTVVRAAQRRLDGEPLQYIIGHWPFRSLDLDVDPRVLIPRPETEELVSVALREVAPVSNAPLILDLGCGSGAIGLALVSELRERGVVASLVALDESLDALAVARRNAVKHQLLSVSFVHSTWFRALDDSLRGRVDAIVTNPPYVGAGEFETLDDVLRYEPRGALVAPDHQGYAGLEDIATILEEGLEWLTPGGVLVMEHGEHQRDVITELARDAGWSDVVDHDDLNGRPRILVGRRPW